MLNLFKEFFGFTKKELNGILVLCLLILLALFMPLISSLLKPEEVYNFDEFKEEIAAFEASERREKERVQARERKLLPQPKSKPVYFRFNPNNLAESSWLKLGLTEKQVRGIKNYELKGGSFRSKADVKKMYTINDELYKRLDPYIDLPEEAPRKPDFVKRENRRRAAEGASGKTVIELNTADSAALESLKGIGPVLASRIVRYRGRLGGFVSREQLREVYGIDSASYVLLQGQLSVDASLITKISINSVAFEELKKNPYLTYKQMNAIIQFRKQHGAYRGIEDLRKIAILNEEILRKIAPYLIF